MKEMICDSAMKEAKILQISLPCLRVVVFSLYRIALSIKPVMISNNRMEINVAIIIRQHFFYEKRHIHSGTFSSNKAGGKVGFDRIQGDQVEEMNMHIYVFFFLLHYINRYVVQ